MIILLLLVVYCIYRIKKLYPKAIDVDPQLVKYIYPEGEYSSTGTMTKTDIYKNGTISNGKTTVTHEDSKVKVNIVHTAYDPKTKEKLYDAIRKVEFYYKPDHGKNLFRTSTTYRNNQIVSHIHGFVIAKTSNSITIHSSGSWQTSKNDYKHIESIQTKTKNGWNADWVHYDIFGFIDVEINDKFNRIK